MYIVKVDLCVLLLSDIFQVFFSSQKPTDTADKAWEAKRPYPRGGGA